MNAEQIIEALVSWIKNFDGKLLNFKNLCEALALIKEQQAEIETLRVENETLKITTIDQYAHLCDCHDKIAEMLRQKEADTVKRMQELIKERCIEGGIYPAFVARTIDQIAKEILEGRE